MRSSLVIGTVFGYTIDMLYVNPVDQRRSFRANAAFLLALGLLLWYGTHLSGWLFPAWNASPDQAFVWAVAKIPGAMFFVWGAGLFAKSKGYDGRWGFVTLPLLLVPGLLLLALLPDKWQHKYSHWGPEYNHLLVNGYEYDFEFEANLALRASARTKVGLAIALTLLFPISSLLASNFSNYTQGVWVGLAMWALVPAAVLFAFAGADLARLKNYDPLIAAMGYFVFPVFGMSILSAQPPSDMAALAMGMGVLVGPLFLMLAPKRFVSRKKSPFETAPQSFYLANPESKMHH